MSKEEAQARTVIVHQPVCSGIQFQKIDEVVVSINNYGDAPILSLTARIWWENMPYGEGDWRQQKYPDTIRVIEAGGDTRLAWSVEIPWPEGVSLESIQRGINCEVTYTDTHGLMWTRGEQGDLRRVH
ncbi:hypothetical protein BG844_29665 [Couchioplanes caeruleus subsp. caeruleus]|uniref:Uncharacterized protein n=1 Tax=Couchioplanes caeruleus subsp. caeruleus TaxID=56427 RepID=A0A1K0FDC7_9ACTN|nr:hypothetical protein BG844_29665 [Couchioplanes caeruleus subsp. caeruleus]